jgi:hypothetical protein
MMAKKINMEDKEKSWIGVLMEAAVPLSTAIFLSVSVFNGSESMLYFPSTHKWLQLVLAIANYFLVFAIVGTARATYRFHKTRDAMLGNKT